MMNLVYKEFVQLRNYILQVVGFMALAIVLFGKISPSFAMSYLYVLPVVMSMTLPQMIFGQEERGNTFVFLRALPIRPGEIVAAKYLVSVIVTVAFLGVIGLSGALGVIPVESVLAALFTVSLASFFLSGLSFLLHFWLGVKSARVALILTTFSLAVPVMLLARRQGDAAEVLSGWVAGLEPIATSVPGVLLAAAVGLLLLAASFAGSAWIFTRRDLSRLP